MNWDTLWAGADVLIRVTIVLLAGGILAVAMGGAAAARRHLVWLLTGCAALAMPVLCAALPAWRAIPAWAGHGAAPGSGTVAQASQSEKGETVLASRHDGGASREERLARPVLVSDVAPSRNTSVKSPPTVRAEAVGAAEPVMPHRAKPSLATPLLLAWSAGCSLLLARLLVSWLLLRRLWRSASQVQAGPIGELLTAAKADLKIRRHVEVRTSPRHAMPMTWGIVRPVILLPAAAPDWSTGRIRLALLHELAHIKRLDSLAQFVGQLCCAVYWFHPLAWLPAAGLRREQERAADDRVLSIDSHDTDYASFLLELARQPACFWGGNAAIAMARPSAMEGRVIAILDVTRRKGSLSVQAGWIAAAVAFALVLPVAAIHGQAQAPPTATAPATQPAAAPAARYTGHVLSPDRKPVAGAEVFVQRWISDLTLETTASTRCGADGAFSLPVPPPTIKRTFPQILARAAGFAPVSLETDNRADYSIKLAEMSSVRMVFIGPDRLPVAGLKVRPWRTYKPTNYVLGEDFALPLYYGTVLSERFTQTTDERGGCVFDMIPRDSITSFQLDDERFAQLSKTPNIRTRSEAQNPVETIQLQLAGGITGRVTYGTTGAPAAGIRISASDKSNAYFGERGEIVTNERGEYRIPQVKEGNYIIRLLGYGDIGWTASFLKDVRVKAGQVVSNQNLVLVKGTVVHGRVYEAETGKPLSGGHMLDIDYSTHEYPASADTDAEGRFVMRIPPGRQGIYLMSAPPDGYSSVGFDPHKQYAINAVDGEDISVELRLVPKPGKPVGGRVIDVDGKPVAGISVRANIPGEDDSNWAGSYIDTNADGSFRFRALTPGSKLTVFKGNIGTLTPVEVQGGEENVVIQLARNVRTAVSGTVVDATGNPIARAGIFLGTAWEQFSQVGSSPATLTDAAGHFSVPNLRPGARYSIWIDANGQSKRVDLNFTPGEEHFDLGRIVMGTAASEK